MQKLIFLLILIFTWSCQSQSGQKDPDTQVQNESMTIDYQAKGKEIAGETFKALSTRLQHALQEGGVSHAVQYCNLAALPITDSLSQVHQAIIRRTSLKVRNPSNAPNEEERSILQQYKKADSLGTELTPIVKQKPAGEAVFYAPIRANTLCLNCHGKVGQELKESDYEIIRKLYPEDQANGYSAGDLRGMWSIAFQSQNNN